MKWELCITMIVLACLALVVCGGCEEAQQQIKWRQGELPPGWVSFFGDGNLSHLNFVQSQVIDRNGGIIYGVNLQDPNGRSVRKRGLIERITTLEGQVEKLKVVDPNE